MSNSEDISLEKYKEINKEMEIILDNIPGLVFYKDSKNNLLRVNKYFADFHNTTKDKLTGMSCFKLYPKERAQAYFQDDLEIIKTGKPKFGVIEPWPTKEGTLWLNSNKIPFVNDEGKVKGIIGFSFDITERFNHENLHYSIFEQSPFSMWISDNKGTFLKQNKTCQDLWDADHEVLVNNFNIFDDPIIAEGNNLTLVKNVFKKGEPAKIIIDYKPVTFKKLTGIKKKTRSILEVTVSPILNQDGEVTNAIIYHNDITQRVIAEEKLEETLEKYRSFIEHSGEGTSIIEFDQPISIILPEKDQIEAIYKYGYIASCNNKFAHLYGFSNANELIGARILDFHGSKEIPENIEFLSSWIRSEYKILNAESVEVDKDGNNVYISNNTIGIIEEGFLIRIWGSQLDISERVSAVKALKESENSFRQAYKRAEFYKDLLSHDINNILQICLSGLQVSELLISQPQNSETIMKNLKIIQDQIFRGKNLIKNVQKLSTIEEKKFDFEKMDVCHLLERVILRLKNLEKEKQVNIQFDSVNKKLFVKANEFLEDVFENILFNAIKHNENSIVQIDISISKFEEKNKKYLRIEFSDNAKGIEDGRKKKIFERGYLDGRSAHGMGIGLSLVNTIMCFLNGKIWVQDRIEGNYKKGSTFIVLIPEIG